MRYRYIERLHEKEKEREKTKKNWWRESACHDRKFSLKLIKEIGILTDFEYKKQTKNQL